MLLHDGPSRFRICPTLHALTLAQDKYFPEDEAEEAPEAQVDQSGAFAFQNNVAAPQGGFMFGGGGAAPGQEDSMAS